MNFFINKAMGIGNSGVEHAQFYRAKCFEKVQLPYKYVFVELVKNLHEAMEAWRIPDNKVINMWEYFVFGNEYLKKGATKTYEYKEEILLDFTNTHRTKETITSSGMFIVEHLEKSPSKKKENLLLVSTYKTEIFDYKTLERKVMFEYIDDKHRGKLISNIHLFDFEGEHLFFRTEVLLQRFFFECLAKQFSGVKNYFVDRGQEAESALFNHKPEGTNIIEIIHADHLSDRDVPSAPLWNNYYEYLLTHMGMVDRVVVATKLQREDLLIDFPKETGKICAIPVGGIRDQAIQQESEPFKNKPIQKFITVSRLASEKHIDIVIKAICDARKQFPMISLDIYGQGGEDNKLREVIKELKAETFVKLKGHSNQISQVYPNYDAFISGSYSEGFGLTYIEALDAGLPIVTFKARFGALELVKDGVNGYLKDFSRTDEEYSREQLKEGILQLLKANHQEIVNNTRISVRDYQDSIIANQWKELINGL
ncbi:MULTISPECIES: glycosyltransferase [Enterococcus]|uniref:Glycosyltransferase n=1 Tax=Enterococcus raffinosus TaxID=71452 RepID=A0AAP5KCJ1_9ENTE|nr:MULTISPECIES: glycosyltransferase [Enterococcus]SAM71073.1 glycosyl transferase family protein [Enterococcus faecium]MDT2524397.1 glycosyltransferase [Enterococcus raffinosus]MDT2535199.1 glycosyltransferase [Enterococcus raffinosus]MDT2546731.1 glycosyltransferase [Enterococcus raffinosus]MDT2553864.1 glycosyltransferase [Enterococcus raffinosus]